MKKILHAEFVAKDVTPSAMRSRLKDPDNVRKVARKKYAGQFANNEDFAGLRISCLFTKELHDCPIGNSATAQRSECGGLAPVDIVMRGWATFDVLDP